eukprot:COSAG02_NODE_20421_length_832_cov_1.731241_2_plen_158_part_00
MGARSATETRRGRAGGAGAGRGWRAQGGGGAVLTAQSRLHCSGRPFGHPSGQHTSCTSPARRSYEDNGQSLTGPEGTIGPKRDCAPQPSSGKLTSASRREDGDGSDDAILIAPMAATANATGPELGGLEFRPRPAALFTAAGQEQNAKMESSTCTFY